MRFRKKPLEIEAQQVRIDNFQEVADWCGGTAVIPKEALDSYIEITTLEGTMQATLGSWVIKGVAGEFYPCDNEIFIKSYEAIPEIQSSMTCTCRNDIGLRDPNCVIHGYPVEEVLT